MSSKWGFGDMTGFLIGLVEIRKYRFSSRASLAPTEAALAASFHGPTATEFALAEPALWAVGLSVIVGLMASSRAGPLPQGDAVVVGFVQKSIGQVTKPARCQRPEPITPAYSNKPPSAGSFPHTQTAPLPARGCRIWSRQMAWHRNENQTSR